MLYFAVATDGLDGGVQITASHKPGKYNGMKMVRKDAWPLSGEEGLAEILQMIESNTIPPPAARHGAVARPASAVSTEPRIRAAPPPSPWLGRSPGTCRRITRSRRHPATC